jgi:hypothetical protein
MIYGEIKVWTCVSTQVEKPKKPRLVTTPSYKYESVDTYTSRLLMY